VNLVFSERAWEDYLYWQSTDRRTVERINNLIKAIQRTPFEGIGNPEPLRHDYAGYWSRRISQDHRLMYRVEGESIFLLQLRYHY